MEIFWAKAYRLEPLTTQGIYSLDGEPVEYGPIQVRSATKLVCIVEWI